MKVSKADNFAHVNKIDEISTEILRTIDIQNSRVIIFEHVLSITTVITHIRINNCKFDEVRYLNNDYCYLLDMHVATK